MARVCARVPQCAFNSVFKRGSLPKIRTTAESRIRIAQQMDARFHSGKSHAKLHIVRQACDLCDLCRRLSFACCATSRHHHSPNNSTGMGQTASSSGGGGGGEAPGAAATGAAAATTAPTTAATTAATTAPTAADAATGAPRERPEPGDGRCCVSGTLDAGTPSGSVEHVGGVETYVARPPPPVAAGAHPAAAVVILTDVFGMVLPNVRLIADRLAREVGVSVYVPDQFAGDAFPIAAMSVDTPATVWGSITRAAKLVVTLPSFVAFVRRHPDAAVRPILAAVMPAVRAAHGGAAARIGVLGYCFGGRYTVLGGPTAAADGVAAIATAHPSMAAVPDDYAAVTVPALYMFSETDFLMSGREMATVRTLAAGRNATLPTQVLDFPGTRHGFAVRGDAADPVVAAARERAAVATTDWFRRFLLAPPAAAVEPPPPPVAAAAAAATSEHSEPDSAPPVPAAVPELSTAL